MAHSYSLGLEVNKQCGNVVFVMEYIGAPHPTNGPSVVVSV